MQTRFILIQPSHAGNVGAAARALKVMDFDDLVLVAPRWPNVLRRQETIQRASGALDVLDKARIVATLDEALDGMDHLCATAMTPRDFGPPTRSPRAHFEMLLKQELPAQESSAPEANLAQNLTGPAGTHTEAATAPPGTRGTGLAGPLGAPPARGEAKTRSVQPGGEPYQPGGVAFLFGCERFGMANEDVYRSHVALSIPTNPKFGSLNLAAAVQLIAYEWRMALGGFAVQAATPAPVLADARQLAGMLAHWEQALTGIGFLDPAAPKKLMPRLNQLFNRAQPQQEEIHILRGIAKAMAQAAAKPAND